jgi:hypothetical protein
LGLHPFSLVVIKLFFNIQFSSPLEAVNGHHRKGRLWRRVSCGTSTSRKLGCHQERPPQQKEKEPAQFPHGKSLPEVADPCQDHFNHDVPFASRWKSIF